MVMETKLHMPETSPGTKKLLTDPLQHLKRDTVNGPLKTMSLFLTEVTVIPEEGANIRGKI
jgi:hypothetical protein